MRIGAHMSAAGGVTRAVERAVLHGCEALQIFTKNNARWISPPIDPTEAARFKSAVRTAGLSPTVAHASYLINLAARPGPMRDKSINGLVDELRRAHELDLAGVVVHPGVAAPESDQAEALALVVDAVRQVLALTDGTAPALLIEHTAGQGRSIGHRFEHLAEILRGVERSPRLGVCLDTCHLLAAGYDIRERAGYDEVFASFDRLIGLDRIRLFHGNDSKRPLGSRLDRHEHIGQGSVGLEAFRRLVTDPRFADLALVIETHKTPGLCDHPKIAREDPLDVMNLTTLRQLRSR